jgi:Recombinase
LLESQGVTTSQGSKTWSKQAIYNLIQNRVYLGELRYGRDDRFVNPDAHEPIVDLPTWTAAQHPNGRKLPLTRTGANLLAGIVRCAGCGYCLQWTTTTRGKRIARCTRTHSGGLCPEPVRTSAEPVEEAAVRAFWSLTADLEAEGIPEEAYDDLSLLEKTLETAERRLAQAKSPEVQDAAGEGWAEMISARRHERDKAAEALGKAQTVAVVPVMSADTLRGAWERMTNEERRALLALRFDCIALSRDGNMVVYPAGTGPAGLPRRGFKRNPELVPFPDVPARARVLAL